MAGIKSFSDQLREAIKHSGQSRYRISKETGIPQSNLSTFANGQTGLSIASIDILCKYLKLRLVGPKSKED